MNLTSTLFKIDLAVLSVLLGVMAFFFKCLRSIQQDLIKEVDRQARIEENIGFHGHRLDAIDNWIAANSQIRKERS